jgi:UDP-glucose 4-epimerase
LELKTIDTVIHLSALVHQMEGASKEAYERINVTQTLKLATNAKESGVAHFLYLSSIKACGEESDIPYTEATPCVPRDEYGKSKYKAEKALQLLSDNDFVVSIIRMPIVYGYGVKANIKHLIALVDKVPLLPFGDIHNKRSMVYIGNLSHLMEALCRKKQGGIFLASDDEAYSTRELIEQIARVLEKKILLVTIPFFQSLLKRVKPEVYKRLYESLKVENQWTRETLGIENPYTFEEGVRWMIRGEPDDPNDS